MAAESDITIEIVEETPITIELVQTGPAGSNGGIQSIVPGDNIEVDNTDPDNPVVSAPGGAQTYDEYVFNSDGAQENNRYNDWDDLMAAIAAVAGPKTITFEKAETIPDGEYNLDHVTLSGNSIPGTFGGVTITSNDVVITSWLEGGLAGGLSWIHNGSGPVISITTGMQYFNIGLGCGIATSAASFFDISGDTGCIFGLNFGANFANQGYEPFTFNGAATIIILLQGSNIGLPDNVFRGDVTGSPTTILLVSDSAAGIDPDRTDANLVGTIYPVLTNDPRLIGYNNQNSGLMAGTVQAAIDELKSLIPTGGGTVESVNSGTGIEVDNNVPGNPVVNISGTTESRLELADSSLQPDDIEDAINDGVTDKAPSENAVFDALAAKQNTLAYTPEDSANKTTNTTPSTSTTTYPASNVLKAGLDLKQNLLTYTPEDVANKSTNTALGVSNNLYPTQNAVRAFIAAGYLALAGGTMTGTLVFNRASTSASLLLRFETANTGRWYYGFYSGDGTDNFELHRGGGGGNPFIARYADGYIQLAFGLQLAYATASRLAIIDASQNLVAADTATYPSLSELAFMKGVTSALQTQLDAKQPLDSDLTTIAGLTATTDNFMVAVSNAWASRTPAQAKTALALTKSDVGLSSVTNDAQVKLSTITAKGDILAGTGSGAVAAVPVGANNLVLTADSAQASGVKWAAAAASGGGFARVTFTNANYVSTATASTIIAQIGTLSAARTVTLPAANALSAGAEILIQDESGSVSNVNTITVLAAGSDTISGDTVVRNPNTPLRYYTDGTSKWFQLLQPQAGIDLMPQARWAATGAQMMTTLVPAQGGPTTSVLAAGAQLMARSRHTGQTVQTLGVIISATSLTAGQSIEVTCYKQYQGGPGAIIWTQSIVVGTSTGFVSLASLAKAMPYGDCWIAVLNPSGNAGSITLRSATAPAMGAPVDFQNGSFAPVFTHTGVASAADLSANQFRSAIASTELAIGGTVFPIIGAWS